MSKVNVKPKLYELAGRKSQRSQQADNFWPLPQTYIGLEIEVEGAANRLIASPVVDRRWALVKDDSLRGGEEWVFNQPTLGKDLTEAVSWFFNNVSNYTMSTRTSTHIHINMMDDECDADALRNTLGLYIAAEDYFFSKAGDERRWSGYCAPLEEAPADLLIAMINGEEGAVGLQRALMTKRANAERYYALNLMSLHKHGTLEFRHFPCTKSEEDVILWIKMVMWLKLGGMRMSADDVNIFEVMGDGAKVRDVLMKYVPEMAEDIIRHCPEYKISSKIAALHTYTGTKHTQLQYSMEREGVFKNWCVKKGVVPEPDLDLLDHVLEEKQQEIRARLQAGTTRDRMAEQTQSEQMANYIRHNTVTRREGGMGLQIPKNVRYLANVDMLPREEREYQNRYWPEAKPGAVKRSLFEAYALPPADRIRGATVNRIWLDEAVPAPPAPDAAVDSPF